MRNAGQEISFGLYRSVIGGLCVFLVLMPLPGQAEIYKYVKNGVTHYTNRPPEQKAYEILRDKAAAPTVRIINTIQDEPLQDPPYTNIIHEIAKAHQLSPELVKAIIKVESNYNHRAVSPKGAQGLMQLMPATADRFGVRDVFDPEENITGGVKFLRYLFDEFGENNLELVLAGYNAGEEAVRKYDNQIPPYRETRAYVKKVVALYLPSSLYRKVRNKSIYRYVNKDGVIAFTNVPRVN